MCRVLIWERVNSKGGQSRFRGPFANVTVCGFAICGRYIFSDLPTQLLFADLKLPQISKYKIFLLTNMASNAVIKFNDDFLLLGQF
jgi:hypothetical protein